MGQVGSPWLSFDEFGSGWQPHWSKLAQIGPNLLKLAAKLAPQSNDVLSNNEQTEQKGLLFALLFVTHGSNDEQKMLTNTDK